jgi:NAD(P)-dependent dehydrogenase (short-subunit alcohol dehydrogenase family)
MSRFTNKIVVITGGTSGIGLAAARQFLKEGATVVVIGRSPRSVGDAQKEIGANGLAIAADVTKSAELDAVFQTVREKYGRIDVLYANAGIAKLGSVAETTEQMFDDILDANFRAAYFAVQKALPLLSDALRLQDGRVSRRWYLHSENQQMAFQDCVDRKAKLPQAGPPSRVRR